jgi:hypothetical protein
MCAMPLSTEKRTCATLGAEEDGVVELINDLY